MFESSSYDLPLLQWPPFASDLAETFGFEVGLDTDLMFEKVELGVVGFGLATAFVVAVDRVARAADGRRDEQVAARAAFQHVGALARKDGVAAAQGQGGSIINVSSVAARHPRWDALVGMNLKGPFRLAALVGRRMAPGLDSLCRRPISGARGDDGGPRSYLGTEGAGERDRAGHLPHRRSRAWDVEAFERQALRFASRRGGETEEIVGAALYLAGDAAGEAIMCPRLSPRLVGPPRSAQKPPL